MVMSVDRDSVHSCVSVNRPTFIKSAKALAPSMGMELYTEARMPPTERWPFSCTCERAMRCTSAMNAPAAELMHTDVRMHGVLLP